MPYKNYNSMEGASGNEDARYMSRMKGGHAKKSMMKGGKYPNKMPYMKGGYAEGGHTHKDMDHMHGHEMMMKGGHAKKRMMGGKMMKGGMASQRRMQSASGMPKTVKKMGGLASYRGK